MIENKKFNYFNIIFININKTKKMILQVMINKENPKNDTVVLSLLFGSSKNDNSTNC